MNLDRMYSTSDIVFKQLSLSLSYQRFYCVALVNLAKQDFEVTPGPLEMLLQYNVKGNKTRQPKSVPVCVYVCTSGP